MIVLPITEDRTNDRIFFFV